MNTKTGNANQTGTQVGTQAGTQAANSTETLTTNQTETKAANSSLAADLSSIRSIIHLDLDGFYAQVESVRLGTD